MNKDVKFNIKKNYSIELENLENKINDLKQGRIYGLNNNNCKSDGSLEKNVQDLEHIIFDLLNKIEYGLESENDKINKLFK